MIRKRSAVLATVAVLAVPATAPAINHPVSPGASCGKSDRAGGPTTPLNDQVGPPASGDNPGESTGARGSENSAAPCNAP